ncbi:anhydro-N-acetylmuramic acid kinase [Lacinutrix iliipiscaria]|uniref:Anhydro-N-acetylmuramic acid kinase n=1 Tax=Lacinutrix iliipiscaria TaxID=1230532 RepID=A0ABW5WQR9_9FLAO
MNKTNYKVIGVMSGTSLDGIDLACVNFQFDGDWHFKMTNCETIPYSQEWYKRLQNLTSYTSKELKDIDLKYTIYLSGIINRFIEKHDLKSIDAICSHGHTALHEPNKGLTYQIGNQKVIASLTKNKVVCDFRVQDVKLGGQGAPLVPIGDKLLFSDYDFCLNLGGFANISFEDHKERIAFDICPVNIVLNFYAQKLGFEFDDGGKLASTGKVNSKLLEELNNLEFYHLKHPKSLGLEWVKKEIFPKINTHKLDIKDVLNTCVEHIAIQISKVILNKKKATVLVSGGGVFNKYLINRIKDLSPTHDIVIPSNDIINYKEALVFGLLGVLKMRNEVNCLKSVTGAKNDHSSGEIYQS